MLEQASGAILVHAVVTSAQASNDLLEFPIYHVEGVDEAVWDMQYALASIADPGFATPILSGYTSTGYAGLYHRIDYRGVPGTITPLTAEGIATLLSEANGAFVAGGLLVPLDEAKLATLTPGGKYILRARQKARGHDEWSVYHDQIISW